MKLRCSKLPLAFACPGSIRPAEGEILIEHANEYAALGSAVHEVLAGMVLASNGDGPDVRATAMKYGVDSDELARLVGYGLHAWRALAQYYPEPETEVDMEYPGETFLLSGHLDLASAGEDWVNFLDWKSGYKQPDYFHQLMGYARLVTAFFHNVKTVRATVVWLRDWTQETLSVTVADVAKWEADLIASVVNWDGVYSAGAHCQYCPRFAACPARQALVRSALVEIGEEGPAVLPSAMPAIVRMYREGKLSVVKGLLEQIDNIIRNYIQAVGPIDLGNGRELALAPEPRDTIDPIKAWPVMSEHLTNEQLAPAIKIGKTALLDAVADLAGKGQKGKAKAALMEELKVAGAVNSQTIYKMRERKIEKEVK
jgi:hypothetical protein